MNELPLFGFGTGMIPDGALCVESVLRALDAGYRLIDTAAIYGNEVSVGQAIAQSGLPREQIFVTSKLHYQQRGREAALRECRASLERLQLDYLDTYMIHWPANAMENPHDWRQLNAESWAGLEELRDLGLVRSIGLSNFMPEHLFALLESARYRPVVNQIELHPGHPQQVCRAYCEKEGIALQAWSPMGMGSRELLSHPLLRRLSMLYGKTTAQICLRWCIQHGSVPLPKSTNAKRIVENADVFDFELHRDAMSQIDALPSLAYSGWDPYTGP